MAESSRQSKSEDSESDDDDIDWESYRVHLDRIFFREDDFIHRGSPDYHDFWKFLHKYVTFQRRKSKLGKQPQRSSDVNSSKFDLPKKYDKRYRINVSLVTQDIQDAFKYKRKCRDVPEKVLSQFRQILLHYVDFHQKQKFTKLVKLKKSKESLPIFAYKEAIVEAVNQYPIVVIAGDTGCGKSTQVPQYLLEAGFGKIACTQPRRIACISLAKRVGYETLNEYGSHVGFQVRFEKSKTSGTKILFLTEGLLLRQMESDTWLPQYDIIVIDEVHERHIHTDFLLGALKCLVQHREDLKIVLMSATININMFSSYFDHCPVIKVPGRLYPIQLEYCPYNKESEYSSDKVKLDPSPYIRIMNRIDHKYPAKERGDLLIFLSGMTEITTVADAAKLYAQKTKKWIILTLHSALSISEQDKVFDIAPEGVRKCIISTNIAETSVTIDGVRFVVDSGKFKEMSFDPKCKMQRLQEFWISQASAEQRKGRSGRTGPGVCFRLYNESDYDEFQEYTTPEIRRVPLDSLTLQMISMGLPNARKFPFIEPPDTASVENSIQFLKEQSAITDDEVLTPVGEMLSKLPVDVVIGKMLIMGSVFHMIDPVLSIAAALSIQNPFTNTRDGDVTAARRSLQSEHGDPFTLLNAFDEWIKIKAEGRGGSKKWCKRKGLEEQRFYEMSKLKSQFQEMLIDHGLLSKEERSDQQTDQMTSHERRKTHGDRKRLRELKREQVQTSKKRKVLKIENEHLPSSDSEDNEPESNIKDLEFRLSHDLNQLQEKSNKSRNFVRRDINLLKIILCSGLYPQVALADDCNAFKADSEQCFHTKSKPFVLLHPTSVFYTQPELLQLQDNDTDRQGSADIRTIMSSKHELVCYVHLVETNKPYLRDVMRVPALQTLLLHAGHIDTNYDLTRLVCDEWLEIKLSDPTWGEDTISSVIQLRTAWLQLLKIRLEEVSSRNDDKQEKNPMVSHLEKQLSRKLTEFLESRVVYSVRRVLAAEVKRMYVGPADNETDGNEETKDLKTQDESSGKVHPIKGGIMVNYYITYNCLAEDSSSSWHGEYSIDDQKHWTCPYCQESFVFTTMERLQHTCDCQLKDEASVGADDVKRKVNPLAKLYHCDVCTEDLMLTATELLRHKRQHLT